MRADGPWLFVAYSTPKGQTPKRAVIRRGLTRAGAVHIQRRACLLPKTASGMEFVKTLAARIHELGGDCIILVAKGLDRGEAKKIADYFEFRASEGNERE